MKVIVALVALIALSVANISSAQYIVLRKCGFSSGASLIESDASSHTSSKINNVQARIAAAVQATETADPIYAKLQAAKAPFTVKNLVPRHSYSRAPKPYFPVTAATQTRLVKIWPSCSAGGDPNAVWAAAWEPIKGIFTDRYGNNVDQAQYFQSAMDVYPVAKAACDLSVKEGARLTTVTGATIQPNGDCQVTLMFDQRLLKLVPFVSYAKFQHLLKK